MSVLTIITSYFLIQIQNNKSMLPLRAIPIDSLHHLFLSTPSLLPQFHPDSPTINTILEIIYYNQSSYHQQIWKRKRPVTRRACKTPPSSRNQEPFPIIFHSTPFPWSLYESDSSINAKYPTVNPLHSLLNHLPVCSTNHV